MEGFRTLRFTQPDRGKGPVSVEAPVAVVKRPDGTHYLGQEHEGMPLWGTDGVKVESLGLNVPVVAEALRRLALTPLTTGAAHLRWADGKPPAPARTTFGVLVLLRQSFRSEGARWVEQGTSLHCYHVAGTGDWVEWHGEDRKAALRGVLGAAVRREPQPDDPLHEALAVCEAGRMQNLRALTDEDRHRGQVYAVLPLVAAIFST